MDSVESGSPFETTRRAPLPATVDEHHRLTGVLWRIHRREPGVVIRIFVSVISGALLAAAAFVGAWLYAVYLRYGNGTSGRSYVWVRDEYLAVSFSLAGLIWSAFLYWTWRYFSNKASFVPTAVGSIVIGIGAILVTVLIDRFVRGEEEYLIAALWLVAGAAVVWLWMGYVERWRAGRPVVTDEGTVNVVCPDCGYSMVGLRELRCPECGAAFSLDEIIRLQNYDGANVERNRMVGANETDGA